MKQGQIVKAYQVIEKLSRQEFPLRDGYKLFRLKKQMQPIFDFRVTEEKKLFEKHPVIDQHGTSLKFKTPEDAKEVDKTLHDLEELETDIEIKPVTIRLTDSITLAPYEFEVLEGIINFVENEPEIKLEVE